MNNDMLTYYKPTKRAWIPVSIAFVVVGVVAFAWIKNGCQLNIESALRIKMGSPDVHIHYSAPQKKLGT